MADNVVLSTNVGTGETLATDQIGAGEHYQRVKLADGTAESTTAVATGAGVDANGLRVVLGATDNAVLDAIDAVLDTIKIDTEAIETAVEGTLTVDGSGVTQPVSAAALPLPSGAATAANQSTANTALAAIETAVEGTLTVGAHAVTNAGTFAVQVADTSFAVADGNALGEGVLVQGDDGTDRKNIHVDATTGDVQVDVTNTVTVDLGTDNDVTVTSGDITATLSGTDNAVLDDIAEKLAPHTTNGHSFYLNQDTSAKAQVKGAAGTIYWIAAFSTDATPVYLNLYNKLSASVTLGTTVPDLQFIVPSPGDANGAGFTINFGPLGIQFGTGITVAAATTYNGSTDPGTNVVLTNMGYE